MEIPYTTDAHPLSGVYNGKLGIWLFLASEVMLFGALFSAYILIRLGSPEWPPPHTGALNVPAAMLNTFVLIASSITVILAWASLKLKDFGKFQLFMWATVLLSFVFLGVKYIEYSDKFHHDHFPSTNTFYAIYFTMTGLHGLHVVGGIVVMLYFLTLGRGLWHTDPTHFTNRIECTGLYWHFVDLVWIFLFPSLYLLNNI